MNFITFIATHIYDIRVYMYVINMLSSSKSMQNKQIQFISDLYFYSFGINTSKHKKCFGIEKHNEMCVSNKLHKFNERKNRKIRPVAIEIE